MFYIPKKWLKNKDNEHRVHDILNKHLYSDIRFEGEQDPIELVTKELTEIGETVILEKLENGKLKGLL